MAGTKLTPEKITSPFQLMAAWFSMLILLVSVLLTAAAKISTPPWAAAYLVIFTSIVILLVLGCVTLMLTVFRPHLQEGKEYAQWLRDKNTYSAGLLVREQPSPNRIPAAARGKKIADEEGIFPVHVNGDAPGAKDVVRALRRAKLRAETYSDAYDRVDEPDRLEEHEAIWVGYRVPVSEAVRAIRVSLDKWPHLKYLHLSNDSDAPPDEVHGEMFIGGSSSTARDYGLRPWCREELESLTEDMSREAFHHAIRDKYS